MRCVDLLKAISPDGFSSLTIFQRMALRFLVKSPSGGYREQPAWKMRATLEEMVMNNTIDFDKEMETHYE